MKKGLLPYRCLIHPEQIITGTCPICKEQELDTKLNSILNNESHNPIVCDKHPDVILHIKWDDEEGTFEFTDCIKCSNRWSITGLINRIFGANT